MVMITLGTEIECGEKIGNHLLNCFLNEDSDNFGPSNNFQVLNKIGGNFPGGSFPGGHFLRGNFPGGNFFGASLQGGSFQGAIFLGAMFPGQFF